jgi:hypothetical protein
MSIKSFDLCEKLTVGEVTVEDPHAVVGIACSYEVVAKVRYGFHVSRSHVPSCAQKTETICSRHAGDHTALKA